MNLTHENLHVYQIAAQFLGWASNFAKKIPRGHSDLVDQMRRAALSIPLNIAEGAGKSTRADGARYFAIARGSALESAAIIDACVILRLGDERVAGEGKELLVRVVSMLSKMSR